MNQAIKKQAIKKYVEFHGRSPHQISAIENKAKDLTLVELAQPETITYISNKINGGGTGRKAYFKHKFNKSTKMYCTPDGKMLVIMGPTMEVTNRGVVG